MFRKSNDFASTLVWVFIGLIISIVSFRYQVGTFNSPGPGFMPLFAGLAVTFCGFVGLGKTVLETQGKTGWRPVLRGYHWGKALIILLSLLVYALLLERVGFFICTAFFIGFLFRIIKPLKWPVVIGGSLLVTVAAYGIFELWLQSQLPKGTWGF